MLRGFFGNLIFAIIARMLCGSHLKSKIDDLARSPKGAIFTSFIWERGHSGFVLIRQFGVHCILNFKASLNSHLCFVYQFSFILKGELITITKLSPSV